MAEKSAAKKDQGKNKKNRQNDKKKNQENGVRHYNEQSVHYSNNANQKKKDKNQKNNVKSVTKKKSGSFLKGFFKHCFLISLYVSVFLGFLYIVDYERFVKIKSGAGALMNKAVGYLPDEVVSKGRTSLEYLQPAGNFVADKFKFVVGQTSNFLNTNPAVKDHWVNIRDIMSITSARIVEYVRTLYSHVIGVFQTGKK